MRATSQASGSADEDRRAASPPATSTSVLTMSVSVARPPEHLEHVAPPPHGAEQRGRRAAAGRGRPPQPPETAERGGRPRAAHVVNPTSFSSSSVVSSSGPSCVELDLRPARAMSSGGRPGLGVDARARAGTRPPRPRRRRSAGSASESRNSTNRCAASAWSAVSRIAAPATLTRARRDRSPARKWFATGAVGVLLLDEVEVVVVDEPELDLARARRPRRPACSSRRASARSPSAPRATCACAPRRARAAWR